MEATVANVLTMRRGVSRTEALVVHLTRDADKLLIVLFLGEMGIAGEVLSKRKTEL